LTICSRFENVGFPTAERALDSWYGIAKSAEWRSIVDLRAVFPHADCVGRCTVFNIHGNRYRLIARINYEFGKVYILGIFTHAEYEREVWKRGCESV